MAAWPFTGEALHLLVVVCRAPSHTLSEDAVESGAHTATLLSGMRTNSTVLAYEAPVDGQKHFWGIDTKSETYADAFKAGHVYSEECAL